jgi:hypothetical protein
VPIVIKSGSFNLLEPSGPVQGWLYLLHTVPKLITLLQAIVNRNSLDRGGSVIRYNHIFDISNSGFVLKKVKVKVTLLQALRFCTGRTAHRRSRGIALLFHDQRH